MGHEKLDANSPKVIEWQNTVKTVVEDNARLQATARTFPGAGASSVSRPTSPSRKRTLKVTDPSHLVLPVKEAQLTMHLDHLVLAGEHLEKVRIQTDP